MKELYDFLQWVEIGAFAGLGLIAVLHWRSRGGAAAGWLAATFGSLAIVSIAALFLPDRIDSSALLWETKLLLVTLSLFPFLLYRFMATFEVQPRWVETSARILAGTVAVYPLLLTDFPEEGDPLTAPLVVYLVLFLISWVFLSTRVAMRLWKGGSGQPGVARRRMRLLSLGAGGLAVGFVISGVFRTGSEITPVSIGVLVLAIATAPLFLLGFAPPRLIRLAWRREEELALRQAVLELMQALNPRQVADILLPAMCDLIGGDHATMRNTDGEVLGTYSQSSYRPPRDGTPLDEDQATIKVSVGSSEISVHASRFTPFFGSEEEQILQTLGVLADMALARSQMFEAEQRKNSFLRILQRVTSSVNAADGTADSKQAVLDIACSEMGWVTGHVYLAGRDHDRLESTRIWFAGTPIEFEEFQKVTEVATFAPGEGLAGGVLATAESIWIENIAGEPTFARREHLPIRGAAVMVPIRVGSSVAGVLELFDSTPRKLDPEALEVLSQIGVQLGRAVERARSREELKKRADELARSNSDLEQFAYVASHDLQEPLRMVSSYVQLLKEDYGGSFDETGERYMHYAVDGATRMQSLVKDLLSFSRVGSRGGEPARVNLDQVLEQTLEDLQISIDETAAEISHAPLPVVMGDAQQLNQLFQNLVGNAIKFHGDKPPRIEISSEGRPAEWVFTVRDNGVGFDQKYAERVFVIFKRLHSREDYAGTGIGLAISKKIVERHGGRIWAESTPGQGTAVSFSLPKMEDLPA